VGAPVRVLVVDDEPLARRGLAVLLRADAEVEVAGECGSGPEALAALARAPVDVLFLDVQMPGMDGFEVLRQLPPGRVGAVVFSTAFDHYALRAFEAHALDYLLKPYDDERFAHVLARAKKHVRDGRVQALAHQLAGLLGGLGPTVQPVAAAGHAAPPASAPLAPAALADPPEAERAARPPLARFVLREAGRVSFLPVEQVDYIEAEDYYVEVHAGGRSHLLRQSLRELEGELDPRRFVRIHRSTIVNVERVKELQPLFHGEYRVLLHDGTALKLSRSYRDRLDTLLAVR
jgi:two-component system LytT family response regulator